ncbi:polysaccharide biosynthesis/export family protein [Sphingomonas corticis]|jgi:polysaccharide export outer membrane protein|uniref:Polysaccharide export protein n=1 Tax=Sphingomonas corticis TaxID=2722791 RepID=A0ABX1CI70_9SPHN|nr:polysaccharide biosynthesis/export family protein [Sphingomonas corticis]NJR77700.1 polysaccharide export protein [Sphingomonas corticis]
MKRRVVLGFAIAMLAGCAGNQGVAPDAPLPTREIPVYRLAADDKLKISVFGEEGLSGDYTIGSDGNLAYPLLGSIPAKGLTLAELTQRITAGLASSIQAPRVSVDVTQYRPFFILGEVNRPGQYPYRTGMTLNSAVATAGGFTYRANQKQVLIQHFGEAGERRYDLTADLPVLPGDTVRVRERFF